jgi:hypothetical protein
LKNFFSKLQTKVTNFRRRKAAKKPKEVKAEGDETAEGNDSDEAPAKPTRKPRKRQPKPKADGETADAAIASNDATATTPSAEIAEPQPRSESNEE